MLTLTPSSPSKKKSGSQEVEELEKYFALFGSKMPKELLQELEALKQRLLNK